MAVVDISIIIVNYKTPEYLFNCIQSIFKNRYGLSLEIIVADNHSQDESEHLIKTNFPEVLWINMDYNSGFSRANNAGIKQAKGAYILLLNSDTVIIDDCLVKSLDYYKSLEKRNVKVGLLGCKMKDLNEQILFNSNSYFPDIKKIIKTNPVYIWFAQKKQKSVEDITTRRITIHCKNHKSVWIGLAFAICSRKIFADEKLFLDEDFFLYSEDVEWCCRLAKKGYRHFFYSAAEIYHINCGSSGSGGWKTAQIIISEWLYIYKTKGIMYYLLYMLIFKVNLYLDRILNKKTDDKVVEIESKIIDRLQINSLLNKFAFKIIKQYKKKPSSGKTFLKYDVQ